MKGGRKVALKEKLSSFSYFVSYALLIPIRGALMSARKTDDRHTDKEGGRERQTDRQTTINRDEKRGRETGRQTYRQTPRDTDRQRQRDRWRGEIEREREGSEPACVLLFQIKNCR